MAALKFDVNSENNCRIIQLVQKGNNAEVSSKTRGKSSEVFAFQVEDMKKIAKYFQDRKMWLPYLLFVMSCNMGRRAGDMLELRWEHLYNPKTGNIRDEMLKITEQKTDKYACPRINRACRDAIELYVQNTGCVPSDNGYMNRVCLQLSGTARGHVYTESGYYKAIKNAAERLGIEYNVGTHSCRKSYGAMSREIHPNDPDSMEILRATFNHNDTKVTSNYIGLTKQKVNAYYDDMGDFFSDYVVGDKEYKHVATKPVVTLDVSDIMDIIKMAYEAGQKNSNETDVMIHVNTVADIYSKVSELAKNM